MNEKLRIYFDYNVFDMIQRERFFYRKQDNIDIFLSVSHVEEFFKAKENDVENKNEEKLQIMKELMKALSKSGMLLKPSKSRVVAEKESFEICLDREKRYDTRDSVEKNGEKLFDKIKLKKEILLKNDSTVKNNSNLSAKEIWKRPEVIEELSCFDAYYEEYKKLQKAILFQKYGFEVIPILKKIQLPKEFHLNYKCFEKGIDNFSLLELIIEYLNNVLCSCGYHRDKNVAKTRSGIHDVSHMIYSTYCHYFVSGDKGLVARANAIYEYLGVTTRAVTVEEFENLCTRLD